MSEEARYYTYRATPDKEVLEVFSDEDRTCLVEERTGPQLLKTLVDETNAWVNKGMD